MSTTRTPRIKLHAGLKSSAIGAALAVLFAQGPAQAATTDLANAPLASGAAVQIKPNMMFILDGSGSMGSLFLPDSVGGDESKVGFKNSQCNYSYYNPGVTYLPPKQADGTDFANASFTAARDDGFGSFETPTNTSTVNLSTSFKAHSGDTAQAAYYFSYSGTQTILPKIAACTQSVPSPYTAPFTASGTGGGTWTKVIVPAAEQQNFANWYSYYRSRILMAKTAASRAFDSIDDKYRVGFITILPMSGSSVSSSKFLKIADFGGTHRTSWYSKLFAQGTGNSTPLREALARVGRYYAGKNDGINAGMIPTQADDPVQYSCQQNFAILTTDGQWNTGDETQGPVKLDGTTNVGNQDGVIAVAPRPMYDGATAVQTRIDKWNEYRYSGSGCSGSRQRVQYRTWTITTNIDPATGNAIGSPGVNSTGYSLGNWYDSSCKTSGSLVPLPPNNASPVPPQISQTSGHTYRRADPAYPAGGFSGNFEQPAPTTPCTAWPCTGAVTSTGGSTDSLADVAQYYYNTDLRPTGSIGGLGNDVSENNVRHKTATSVEDDAADWQHMTTFTMGLGLAGNLTYSPTYKGDTTGDFASIRAGSKNWPVPVATNNGGPPENVDDLWHAAADGRGLFFSANIPDEVVNGLTTALKAVTAETASAAAAATSNLEPVAGDNYAYTAKYTTVQWTGDLEEHQINLADGTVNPTADWSAAAKLDAMTGAACDNRTIKLFRAGASNNLVDFTANTQKCDAGGNPTGAADSSLNASELANFGTLQATALTQGMDASQQAAAAGANFVNYVRGQRGKELFVTGDVNHLFRDRIHILGDIVNAQPVFVRGAIGNYSETLNPGYSAYKLAQANRTPMVYIAANDGMLHAFLAGQNQVDSNGNVTSIDPNGGVEAWAFVPTMVLPNLYKLADANYADTHIYTVDGTPVTGDVRDSTGTWRTILVGGLNGGGRGYYALDITDPANPKALWEFKNGSTCYPTDSFGDCDLGFSFGNPLIAKLTDGTWAVFGTTGYNNASGVGALYVLDAITGKILQKISTGVGSPASPSGLNKIAGWADDPLIDNVAQRIYGVDLLGNTWRFDVNDILGPAGRDAELLATAKDPSGNPQPITTKPELGLAGSPLTPTIYVATGRYLGTSDLPAPPAVPQIQSVYAIKDTLSMTPIADLRATLMENKITLAQFDPDFDPVTGTNGPLPPITIRQSGCANNCSSTAGWFVDLPESGERANVDPKLQLGTLVVPTNVPENNSCSIGGHSWVNFFDYSNGLAVSSSPGASVGQQLSSSLVVGINVVRLPGGKTVVIATTSNAKQTTVNAPFAAAGLSGKRVSWRELVQ
jgi:type IV pilus assembly protein PilY1